MGIITCMEKEYSLTLKGFKTPEQELKDGIKLFEKQEIEKLEQKKKFKEKVISSVKKKLTPKEIKALGL